MFRKLVCPLLLATIGVACDNAGEGRVLSVTGTASVTGTLFLDVDGSLVFADPDLPVEGASVALVFSRAPDTVAVARTSSSGTFTMVDVPVGQFRILVDDASLPDSVEVVNYAPGIVDLSPSEDRPVNIAVGFPAFLARVVHLAPLGSRMFVHGSVTSGTQAFGDSTLHLADSSGAVRVVGIRQGSASIGDSVRVRGVVGVRNGEQVLDEAVVFGLGPGRVIAPEEVTTALAADVDTTRLVAWLVEVVDAVIQDTATVGDDYRMTVDDGSGPVVVEIDQNLTVSRDPYVPDAAVDVVGVLVSGPTGRVLKPRNSGDLAVVVSSETVSEARTGVLGRNVVVTAIAEHASSMFADTLQHVQDVTGSIRVFGQVPGVSQGDSVIVRGITATRNGQRVLRDATVTVVGTGTPLPLSEQGTGTVANAGGGPLDARVVRINNAQVQSKSTAGSTTLIVVDDGSGEVTIAVLDATGIDTSPYVADRVLTATGVLVPNGAGVWRLLPRRPDDLSIFVDEVTVAEARSRPLGLDVEVRAVAQHGSTLFADTMQHIQDATGTIRVLGPVPGVNQGDSVVVRGLTALHDGQRVIEDASVSVVGNGTLLPVGTHNTVTAANAASGSLDARVVRINNAQVQSTMSAGTTTSIVVTDGSGPVTVSVLAASGIDPSPYVVNRVLTATGVLVPTGPGTWRLVPRQSADVAVVVETATVAQARSGSVGRDVEIRAVAEHGSTLFADTLQHIQDATGSIRVVGQMAGVDQSDSVVVRGITAVRDGQRVLQSATVTVVGTGTLLPVSTQNTVTAANASNGSLDARVVRVTNAQVQSTSVAGTTTLIVVNDGSGPVTVAVLVGSGIDPSPYTDDRFLTVTGVLVPSGPNTWQLVPRSSGEITIVVELATVAQAKAGALGRDVEVRGVSEHASTLFADTLQHVQDATGAIRVFGGVPAVDLGDSVIVRGRTAVRSGQRVLENASITVVGPGTPRPISTVATATAATANGGAFDALVVRVTNAQVQDTSSSGSTKLIVVNDGSGVVTLAVLNASAISTSPYVPGMVLSAQGMLVPGGAGTWQLMPRVSSDLSVIVPYLSVSGARNALTGSQVVTAGIALNGSSTFGDGTVHIVDPTGAIRVSGLQALGVNAGDSVRVRGTVNAVSGQPTVASSQTIVLATTATPGPTALSTALAATANGGQRDAALVRVTNAAITARATSGNDIVVTVTDGSGPLAVRIDGDAGINSTALIPGAVINVDGLLVPAGGGVWSLKPRSLSDITVVVPVVSIEAARGLPIGSDVVIAGRALNRWDIFGDSLVYVRGADAAIRVAELPSTNVFPGDSVRIRGLIGQRNGQPVLRGTSFLFITAFGAPTGLGVSTLDAADAQAGRLDAELVRVVNAIVSSVTPGAQGIAVVMDDGSGPVTMLLDADITFDTSLIVPTANLTVTGLLTPSGAVWVTKPRSDADITRNN